MQQSQRQSGWRFVTVLSLMGLPGLGASTYADIFHLHTGGTVSGQLQKVEDGQYHIRTVVGNVRLPTTDVERVEPAATPFEEYEQRRQRAADTPADQTALAAWCDEQELLAKRNEHLARALELDPDYEPAHRALGHVRVGDWWIDGRTVVDARSEATARGAAVTGEERLARAIRGQWRRRIRVIQATLLSDQREDKVKEGWDRILEIKDPLAVGPLTEVLTGGDVSDRLLLVRALGEFSDDEATMNLALIALVDPDPDVRRQAVGKLATRADSRVKEQYRRALRLRNDVLLRRAAYALGELGVKEAVPELIDVLTARREKYVEVPVHDYFHVWPEIWESPQGRSVYRFSGTRAAWGPRAGYGVWFIADQVVNEWRYREVTVYRTEVLEALRKLTGQNLGFERAEWRAWLATQPGGAAG